MAQVLQVDKHYTLLADDKLQVYSNGTLLFFFFFLVLCARTCRNAWIARWKSERQLQCATKKRGKEETGFCYC